MRRLLLTSLGMGALVDFVGDTPTDLTVAFVPTAGDPYEKPTFVDDDRKKLRTMCLSLFCLTMVKKNMQQSTTK
jgi:peptidase E